ncbi:hypothetical protein Cmaq_0689 [Caldivirga maquilingensis IC-167]|uniref:Uncharacterized protein n=2 Tax=Caldivirga maquilingensis TaxID=76887 RepID=A8MCM3_CALMQ|nr:hypothetical protein Cmaq_0689 [Caldivirga maquilingensis IC-167]
MKSARRLNPVVKKVPVDPIKYYDSVGELMLDFMVNRTTQVIVQQSSGVRLIRSIEGKPIVINSINDLKSFVAQGGLDFMASVKPIGSSNVDVLVADIKVKQVMFNTPEGYLIMHIASNAVRLGFEAVGIGNVLMYFDGMNGFKVFARLNEKNGVDLKNASKLLRIIIDAAERAMKRFSRFSGLMSNVTLGVNTLSKVKAFRVPLSIHWSTKLSAIPIPHFCVKNFSLMDAEPVKTLSNPSAYSFMRNLKPNSVNLTQLLADEDYVLTYRIKAHILSGIRLEC